MKLRSQALSLIFLFVFQITGMAQSADGNLKLKPMRSKTGLTISGNLRQLALQSSMVDSLAFEYSDPITGEDIVIPIHRDASGNFSTHLPIQSATQLRLLQGTKTGDKVRFGGLIQFYLYAQPGKDFSLKFFQSADHKERKIEYGGLAGAINTQYQAYTKALDHSEFSRIMEYEELMKAKKDSLEAFKQHISQRLKQVLAFNRDYFATHRVDPFVSEQADIEQRYGMACIYVNVLLREKIQDPDMLDFFKANQIIFDNPQALANQRYQTFIDQYYFLVRYKALDGDQGVTVTGNQIAEYILQPDKGFGEEAKRDARRFLDTLNYPADKHSNNLFYEKYVAPLVPSYVADSEHNLPEFDYVLGLKDPYLRDVYATKTLYKYLSPTKIAFIKPNLKAYREGVASTVLKKRFLNDYERMYDELYHSKLPPKAILHDAAQLDAKDPLGSILSKYKGKVVYVDVWATWCAPCIAEMPNSRVLREKMSGKDIVFVYLCVSSAQEKSWKELVASQNMEGENYFLKRELYSPIANQLEIKTIPRYFIVDRTGRIVDKNALRPGDSATLKQLTDLLVQ